MSYKPQVAKNHYQNLSYLSKDRWVNYWYQLSVVLGTGSESLLEIGKGVGVVGDFLKGMGIKVITLDIAADLKPDIVASVTDIPLADNSFDMVVAAEVLEHISYKDFSKALSQIKRVSRRYAYLTLPYSGYTFRLMAKAPGLSEKGVVVKIPFFWKKETSTSQHYWEIGLKGYRLSRIIKDIEQSGFYIAYKRCYPDDPAHYHFLLEKKF